MSKRDEDKPALYLAAVITAVWVVSFCVDLFVATYEPPAAVMPLMLAAAGYLFGRGALPKHRNPPSHPPREEGPS